MTADKAPADKVPTILVVDDNLQNREVAEGHLVAAGYAAIQAEGGAQALVLLEQRRPDLVLLDVLMPGMDGFETCRSIRARPDGADVPILFLTALGDLGTHKAALDSGADDFLTKPINRTELLIRVRSLLRIKELSDERNRNYEIIRSQRDALLEADRRKEELTALIIHDLKNPLSSILSNVQFVVGQRGLDGEQRESLLDVLRASQSMARMVMNLLDVSRSEDGVLEAHRSEFDLPELLREVCSEAARRVEDKNQKLAVSVSPELGLVTADRDLLRRILENLIDNAYKYGPRHGTIGVEVAPAPRGQGPGQEDDGDGDGDAGDRDAPGAIEIRVHDQGEGIPVPFRLKIFEKYARVDGRPAHELRSSHGLGLVFCRRAVDLHGGRIWVEDNHPRGSCFCVRLAIRSRQSAGAADGSAAVDDAMVSGRPAPASV
jgi:two-component system sensor histidine kinase/response regulator